VKINDNLENVWIIAIVNESNENDGRREEENDKWREGNVNQWECLKMKMKKKRRKYAEEEKIEE